MIDDAAPQDAALQPEATWHLAALTVAAAARAERAEGAGLDATVPTCPGWTVADLVAHQGMVHRWAASNLRLDGADIPSTIEILRDVPAADLLPWFADGVTELLETFAATPSDVAAMVFLNDAPAPRAFWARRQAHETTIHSIDALAAGLGRYPTAEEAGVDHDLALDAIDELLRGFFTRGSSGLAEDRPLRIAVQPTDAGRGWLLHARPEGIVTDRVAHSVSPTTPPDGTAADAVFCGTAAQLYLGLWNRGAEITSAGRTDVLDRWHQVQRVRWS